jgi:hypothetical protein
MIVRGWGERCGIGAASGAGRQASYRLHASMDTEFPRHRVEFSMPIYLSREDDYEDLLLLDMDFTNRGQQRVNLVVGLSWEWRPSPSSERGLGPYLIRPERGPIGRLELLHEPIDVPPEQTTSGHLAFRVSSVNGLEAGEHHEATVQSGYTIVMRLSDYVSDTYTDYPLKLPPAKSKGS